MEIEKKYKDRIEKYAKKIGEKPIDLEKKFTEYIQKYKGKPVQVAWNKFYGELVREEGALYGNAPIFLGYVCGDTGLTDIIDAMMEKANRMFKDPERREEAIGKGYIDRHGTPLDYRTKIFGRDNDNYGQPLEGHAYNRRLYAITGSFPEFTYPSITEITFTNEAAEALEDVPLQTFYKFRARIYDKKGSEIRNLNGGKITKFKDFDIKYLPDELVAKCKNVYNISDIPDVYSLKFKDRAFKDQDPILLEANIADMNLAKKADDSGSRRNRNHGFMLKDFEVDDIDQPAIRCYMPPINKVTFLPDSRLYFLGRVRKTIYRNNESYLFNAEGFVPIKDLTLY